MGKLTEKIADEAHQVEEAAAFCGSVTYVYQQLCAGMQHCCRAIATCEGLENHEIRAELADLAADTAENAAEDAEELLHKEEKIEEAAGCIERFFRALGNRLHCS